MLTVTWFKMYRSARLKVRLMHSASTCVSVAVCFYAVENYAATLLFHVHFHSTTCQLLPTVCFMLCSIMRIRGTQIYKRFAFVLAVFYVDYSLLLTAHSMARWR
jgi:hypothetical protein